VNAGFVTSAFVRDLPRSEIKQRGLPMRWWGEFQQPLIAFCPFAGRVVVPSGFLTDGASVPRAVWAILPSNDPAILYPAYVHDYLYSIQGRLEGRTLTRDKCDAILAELMLAGGAGRIKTALVRAALKVGGWAAWRAHA
jgi:hypothetical protein